MAHTYPRATMNCNTTRRHFLMTALGGVLGGMALPRRSFAQATGVVPLNDRLSLVTTGGTNVVALSTSDGLIVVDSGTPELIPQLTASLKQLASGQRVTTVFNTHWHSDNTA